MSFIASRFGAATGRDLIEVHLTGAEVCPHMTSQSLCSNWLSAVDFAYLCVHRDLMHSAESLRSLQARILVFWDVTLPCWLRGARRFERTGSLPSKGSGRTRSPVLNFIIKKEITFLGNDGSYSPTTHRHIPKKPNLHAHPCGNSRSRQLTVTWLVRKVQTVTELSGRIKMIGINWLYSYPLPSES